MKSIRPIYGAKVTSSNFWRYISDIKKYKSLNKEEERLLLEEYNKTKDKNIAFKIISSNFKIVISISKYYHHKTKINMEDLISVGNLGLLKALDKFNLQKDVKFYTYAVYWIRREITIFISENYPTKISYVAYNKMRKIQNYKNSHIAQDIFLGIDDIVETFNVNSELACNMLDSPNYIEETSLIKIKNNMEDKLINEDYYDNYETVIDKLEKEEVNKIVRERLEKLLDQREYFIITGYFGIGKNSMSKLTLSKKLGLTVERVRQIIMSSLEKLKSDKELLKLIC